MTSAHELQQISQACQDALLEVTRDGFGCALTACPEPVHDVHVISARMILLTPAGRVDLWIQTSTAFAVGGLLHLLKRPAGTECAPEDITGFVGEFCNMVAGCAAGLLGASGVSMEVGIPSIRGNDEFGQARGDRRLGQWDGGLGRVSLALRVLEVS
jgi:hypothetical protein